MLKMGENLVEFLQNEVKMAVCLKPAALTVGVGFPLLTLLSMAW